MKLRLAFAAARVLSVLLWLIWWAYVGFLCGDVARVLLFEGGQ